MKYIKQIVVPAVILIGACERQSVHHEVIDLIPERIEGQVIMSAPADSVSRVYVVGNTICSFFERGKNRHVLELRDFHDSGKVKQLVPYGENTGEMLLVDLSHNGNSIVLTDIVKKEFTEIDVTEASVNDAYNPVFRPLSILSQEMIPYKNGRMIFLNPYSFQGGARYIITDSLGTYTERNTYEYDSFNVLDGCLLYNEDLDRVAFLSLYEPIIEIFNRENAEKIAEAVIPRKETVDITKIKGYDGTIEYLFVNHVPKCFVAADSNSKSVVGAYKDEFGCYYAVLLDWDGNTTHVFTLDGETKNISISDSLNCIYCWRTNGENDILEKISYDAPDDSYSISQSGGSDN